tara:strand:- start:20419 stop:22839 length:2421 start_codon:yes stop_codon:yes gene_type:complete
MRLAKFLNEGNEIVLIFLAWLVCFVIDTFWILAHKLPPAWDQSTHLSSAFEISYLINSFNLFDSQWWQELWSKAPTYRGPFTYLITVPILKLWGLSYKAAIFVNQIFNGILFFSTYYLAKFIHSRQAGLWAVFFCAVSPVFLDQRIDYLIDFPLTALITTSWLLFSYLRWKKDINKWLIAFFFGSSLGMIFLTRPTGLIFFFIPFLLITFTIIGDIFRSKYTQFFQISFSLFLGLLISWPWFSLNWLTILTSINKARQWGVLYQDGLEVNSLGAWLFYPLKIPTIIGSFLFGLIIVGIFIELIQKLNTNKFSAKKNIFIRPLIWWLSFPLGGLITCILMSSKDIRFVLPLLPQLFILLGVIISIIQRRWSFIWKLSIILVGVCSVIWNQFGLGVNLTGREPNIPNVSEEWPIAQIIKYIKEDNPNYLSNLAVLPDSKYLNAFNLDAEGKKQGNIVSARQTVSQLKYVHQELSNFDWFLIKSGDQGIMSNERQEEIKRLLQISPYFTKEKEWELPDKSKSFLFKRITPTFEIEETKCTKYIPNVRVNSIEGGLEINVSAYVDQLIGSKLLVDLNSDDKNIRADQSIAQGFMRIQEEDKHKCINAIQRLSIQIDKNDIDKLFLPSISLLKSNGTLTELNIINNRLISLKLKNNDLGSIASNRIDLLLNMSSDLREGKFDDLFNKVGQVNQSDPEQIYLKDSEAILIARLVKEPENLDYLYALALSQTLQRKALNANQTFNKIISLDTNNQYAYLAKSVVEIYRFKTDKAKQSIIRAEYLNTDENITEIIKTIEKVITILNLNFTANNN